MKNYFLYLMAMAIMVACGNGDKNKSDKLNVDGAQYAEPFRPQYHFTPKEMWMNDPNGLVYHEGIYHLFYQYSPEDIVWGPKHWGHAVSKDMVHWQHKPIALYPDEHGYIFSGSAVVDKMNTSGFGEEGQQPLVAIYTYHLMESEKAGRDDFQTQGIAYSLDNGDTWVKYEGNPVIDNEGIRDFRDPKVFWHEPSEVWIMTLVAGDHAKFYSSKNLREWEYLSDFGKEQGAHGGVWECPDLIKFNVEGANEEKWVLIISINPGAPNGGSGTQYFVGDFDGSSFTTNQEEIKWLDWGTDNYAGVTYNNAPNDECIFIGWMSNWTYARDTPTKKWRSAMTLPRKLTLAKEGNIYFLKNTPLVQLASLKSEVATKSFDITPGQVKEMEFETNNQAQVVITTSSNKFEMKFANAKGENMVLGINDTVAYLDRRQSGKIDFHEEFGKTVHKMSLKGLAQESYEVSLYIDRSSVEVFIDDGKFVMTEQIFPTAPYTSLSITNRGTESLQVKNLKVQKIKSIW
ncbi:MAG: glycoside hydrolase family 32 protein [Croceitalea sp.]|nr:glycoside hydrolase family 32 protein [Croceitalea sp.]